MTAQALLADLAGRGVELRADGDRLRFRPVDAVPAELRELMRTLKPDLLRLLAAPPRAPEPEPTAQLNRFREPTARERVMLDCVADALAEQAATFRAAANVIDGNAPKSG